MHASKARGSSEVEELRRESSARIRIGLSSFTENQTEEHRPNTNTQMSEHGRVHTEGLLGKGNKHTQQKSTDGL